MKRMEFTRSANCGNHATSVRRIDKQYVLTLPDRHVCRLIDAGRQQVQIGMRNLDEEFAPVIFARQRPHRGPSRKSFLPGGQERKPRRRRVMANRNALLRSIPSKSASSAKRYRLFRATHELKNRQAAIKALNVWRAGIILCRHRSRSVRNLFNRAQICVILPDTICWCRPKNPALLCSNAKSIIPSSATRMDVNSSHASGLPVHSQLSPESDAPKQGDLLCLSYLR